MTSPRSSQSRSRRSGFRRPGSGATGRFTGLPQFRAWPYASAQTAALVLLVVAVTLGGASREHALRLALVELAALPLLALAVIGLIEGRGDRPSPLALGVLGGLFGLLALHLVPLPPGIWQALPGREQMSLALQVSGLAPGWTPLSLTPERTWQSALALLPPAALFLHAASATRQERRELIIASTLLTLASLLLGIAQAVTSAPALYPWSTTAPGWMVGFFANRNHLATLCLMSLPFAVALGLGSLGHAKGRGILRSANLRAWVTLSYVALIVIAIASIRSRAGIVLALPTLALSIAVVARELPAKRILPVVGGVVGVSALAVAAVLFLALGPLAERFVGEGEIEQRVERWPYVVQAAQSYSPVGSGIGSFDPVYRAVEPLNLLDATFFNQAHNEYLETWLDSGLLGLGLIILFGVWAFRRSTHVWLTRAQENAAILGRAASVAIVVVTAHSLVDYPLRTETIAVLFALSCAVLDAAGRTRAD